MGLTVGLIGCGKMGSAIALGLLANDDEALIRACDTEPDAMRDLADAAAERGAIDRVVTIDSAEACARNVDVLVLAVKPHQVAPILEELASLNDLAVISVAAGVSIARLRSTHPRSVRVMPNTPALVGAGATILLEDSEADRESLNLARTIFSAVGDVFPIQKEEDIHPATAIGGSGPALIAMVVEALADGGVVGGLPRKMAMDLARKMVIGTAKLLAEQHPGELKDGVASPGGTTIAGVRAAEQGGLRSALIEAVVAITERSQEMK